MSFEPEPGTRIKLHHEEIEFLSLEAGGSASVFVYAESGKEGTVYKVLKNKETYALKVFYPEYRDKRLLENTEKLSRFKHLDGFRVAERTVLTQSAFPELIKKYPELNYAVLMPWVEGALWGNLMLDGEELLPRENYLKIAQSLTWVVLNLEAQGLAHCDLSNNNFIINPNFSSIQLIDIEDMYAPDMPRPVPTVSFGTLGYRTKWIAENGLWGPESDRFALAVLCAEILTWHNQEIRERKAGSASFFDEDEIGTICDRYKLMINYLSELNNDLPELFEKAWIAPDPTHCPPIFQWLGAIEKLNPETELPNDLPRTTETPSSAEALSAYVSTNITEESHTIRTPQPRDKPVPIENIEASAETMLQTSASVTMARGVPAKMELNHEILDFGIITNHPKALTLLISNTGGAILRGTITSEQWLELSEQTFNILPGEKRTISLMPNATRLPKPKNGAEYRTASALTIESNTGVEVLAGNYKFPQQPIYKTWWGCLLITGCVGIGILLFVILFAVFLQL